MNWSHRNFVRALGVLGAVGVGWGVNAHDEPPRGEAASPTKIEVDESGPLEREFLAGPVKVVLRVGRREIRVAERFEVELEAHTDRDHDLVWPPPPAQLDELRVVSVRDESPERQADGSLVLRRRISLEPFLDDDGHEGQLVANRAFEFGDRERKGSVARQQHHGPARVGQPCRHRAAQPIANHAAASAG